MDNKTIDGVPLHWAEIEAAVRGAFEDGKKEYKGCMRERLRELRALLDAPACKTCCDQGEPEAWQHRVTAGPQTGWSLWAPGKGKEWAEHYTVEVRPLYAEQPAPVATITLGEKNLGCYGSLYDGPSVRRAYTYKHQPGNQAAAALGNAWRHANRGGDSIDAGLSLLCELERAGYGVFKV